MDTFYILITAILTLVLVLITFYYSIKSKKQLEKNLEDTKNEVAMAARPLVVIRAVVHEAAMVYDDGLVSAPKGARKSAGRPLPSHFSHFELFNAGNSPAIDMDISLVNADNNIIQRETLGFLRNNEQALIFTPIRLELNKPYDLVCEYESIHSRGSKIWFQTWLPFTAVESAEKNKISINVLELDFKEVSIAERINVQTTRQKPHKR